VAAALLAGCGGGDDPAPPAADAGVFMTGLVRSIAAGNYGRAWESLYPAHQQVASRPQYVACERRDHIPSRVARIVVVRVVDERVDVAGQDARSVGAAITLRLRVGSDAGTDVVTNTFHAVAVDGTWTWVLPPARYAAYSSGRCP
jgi:hypothetical protein